MSLDELESAVRRLPDEELAAFARWFEEFLADIRDRRVEVDIQVGHLDEASGRVDANFDQRAIRAVALRNAVGRLDDMP